MMKILPSLIIFITLSILPVNVFASGVNAKKDEIKTLEKQIKLELKELKNIESKIHRIKAGQKAKIKNLVTLYSSMSPKSAASIIPHINKNVAVYILSNMAPRTASAIISRMPTADAVFFTNSIAGK